MAYCYGMYKVTKGVPENKFLCSGVVKCEYHDAIEMEKEYWQISK